MTASSGQDAMVQNTAINTLLQSEDSEARRLLGTLDYISDLEIGLINTIDDPCKSFYYELRTFFRYSVVHMSSVPLQIYAQCCFLSDHLIQL